MRLTQNEEKQKLNVVKSNSFSYFPVDALGAESELPEENENENENIPTIHSKDSLTPRHSRPNSSMKKLDHLNKRDSKASLAFPSMIKEAKGFAYRRKSDCCSLCGGISALELRTADIVVNPPNRIQTPSPMQITVPESKPSQYLRRLSRNFSKSSVSIVSYANLYSRATLFVNSFIDPIKAFKSKNYATKY